MSPTGWGGVTISTNNPKVDGTYYDIISSDYVSLAASGTKNILVKTCYESPCSSTTQLEATVTLE